ncbi:MAG: hypothetical protein ACLFT4_11145 [Bacteroidales bacterium]
MSLSDKDIEQIERYLLGELTEEGKTTLEHRIKNDPEFAQQLNFMRDVMNVSKQKGREQLKQNLKKAEKKEAAGIEEKISQSANTKKTHNKTHHITLRNWFYWVPAAAAAIFIGLYVGVIGPSGQGKKLYNEYFEPYPNEVIPFARGENVPEKFKHFSQKEYNFIVRAIKHYERGNYKEASDLFKQHVERKEVNAELIFYMGISQLKSGEEQQAQENLSYVLNLDEMEFQQEAQWYMALTYLKINDIESARQILKEISETSGHPYKNKAQNVIGEISKK